MTQKLSNQRLCLGAGAHLELLKTGTWEFVRRTRGTGVVGIIALTQHDELLIVEQFRAPVDARVVELPAGLIGDDGDESVLEAARRELAEETGYSAPIGQFQWLMQGPSSAGLTDETVQIVIARNVERVSTGGGVGDERIEVSTVPIGSLDSWIQRRSEQGMLIDFKVRLAASLLPEGGSR